MTDTHENTGENAIRDALAAIADEAPAPDRLRSTLAGRTRAHHQRRILLTAGGLVTAGAAVGFTGYAVTRERHGPRPADPVGGWLRVPYAYHPGWLPDGVGLSELGAVVEAGEVRLVTRRWQPPGRSEDSPDPVVELVIGDHRLGRTGPYDGAKTFDIDGVGGRYKIRAFRVPGDPSFPADSPRWGDLAWDPPDAPPLRVTYTGDGSYDDDDPAVRVARSVRPDPRSFALHPRFGWLPDRFAGGPLTIRAGVRAGGWYQEVVANANDGVEDMGVGINMGTAELEGIRMDDARPQPVRGLDGLYQNGFLRFTLPDGTDVSMWVPGATDDAPPSPDLLRVAEEFEFGEWPDLSWAGTR